ncbi:Acetyltransferase (GNAT) family protein [Dyadobacter koreensis]|uniref:Acetyltransferase (GNAT) family protein n=1 Tax=Dyadobacter koreensis TaxID=408657 RepID=A0A1H6WW22_9BACT|nr:GNAT family N-acetyltransferase [Dyadobacter koreensis]SEJ21099.1 Acetyltransferase (GNAT) family protein [Dyadobacter koreensis]
MNNTIEFTFARTDQEIDQILALQQLNLKTNISEAVKQDQGFLTVCHTRQQLELMSDATPQIIATVNENVIAFALAMLPSLGKLIPDLQPMFEICDNILWNGKLVSEYNYYVMGQVCVSEPFRGQGVFDRLYQTHKALYQPKFDLLVTEISTSNKRSQRAHERIGFETIHVHQDHVDEWNVVAWKF